MNQEFFVWSNKNRLPATTDITNALTAAGFPCRVQEPRDADRDPTQWNQLCLISETEGADLNCLVTVTIPSTDHIRQMAEDYENLPFQVKNAARKYAIRANSDEYGQATMFQLRVVAIMTELSHGVVEDPQESGLMMLDEFEDFIAST
jgi:hypothetical protein